MTCLVKLIMCLFSGMLVTGSLEAATTQPSSVAAAAQCPQGQCPQGNGDESDIDEEESAVDRGDANDDDVLIMEEDEDSNAAGVGN